MMQSTGFFSRRHRGVPVFGLIIAALVLAISAASPPTSVEAAVVTFEVEMIGANEVPAASSAGSGFARFTFNDETRELTYAVWMRGLTSGLVTASHIHRAPPGVAGPPIHTLATAPFDVISGSITLSAADVTDLRAGNLYVNIHSTLNPAGFARGQLALPVSGSPAAISPPSTGDGGLIEPAAGFGAFGLLAVMVVVVGATALAARGARHA